jgi:iron(III) transport system substrate-binding protein
VVGIVFQHDAVTQAVNFADQDRRPCEGTGYEIGSMSIIKGAKQPGQRKQVVRLGAVARGAGHRRRRQELPGAVEQEGAGAAQAPKLAQIKLIDYDFAKYGSAAERTRLLKKWDNDVSKLPK